jgi:peptidoglycan hydrolase-like protein with peptidoglycan-binding domain
MIAVPRSTVYTLKKGLTQSAGVYALQSLLVKKGFYVVRDGDFGNNTFEAVKKLQGSLGLGPSGIDGVAGPVTQSRAVQDTVSFYERERNLPALLLFSKVGYESGFYLGAVNWSSPGGVDCGITQRRVYDEDYANQAVILRAFDPGYQLRLSAERMRELYEIFLSRPGTGGNHKLSWRLAVLNHNYPALADRISRVGVSGLSSYYTSPQQWVTSYGLKFPDGAPIRTPLEWGQRYALGNSAHNEPGQAVKATVW